MKIATAILLLSSLSFAQYKIEARDTSCGGFPKVTVGSMENSCVGLVADKNLKDENGETLRFPRKIVELAPNRFLISDMGGWEPKNRGALWELDLSNNQKKLTKLLKGLYLPHDIEWGPDGNLYIGELGKVVRYSKQALLNRQPLQGVPVVQGIPTNIESPNVHPLVNFAFGAGPDDKWNLYINVGAPTDACKNDAPGKCADGAKHGLIRRYEYQAGTNSWNPNFEVWASGLRNSMGLVSHPSGLLLQVENSRDLKNKNEPFEEMNVVQRGKNYGWPYCYNFQATSSEWSRVIDCTKGFEKPFVLLPPHAAPLEIMYYNGSMFPELKNNVLVSFHGHQPTGSFIVAYPTDASGLPNYQNASTWEYSSDGEKMRANPEGGNLRAAKYSEIVSNWTKREGVRPKGRPVGMVVASDGSILIVEDVNGTILRLARGKGEDRLDDSQEVAREKRAKIELGLHKLKNIQNAMESYNWINQNVIQSSCASCHTDLAGTGTEAFEFMIGADWMKGGSDSTLIKRLRGVGGGMQMPQGAAPLDSKVVDYIESFVKAF